ncbi:hypothetical protein HanIR_Chr15g0781681 [Helianthus annuus]|nr:hypothetical protein HanIR_Chr15g0781681 [Helianthus annuus]
MGLLYNFQELSPKKVPVVEVTRNRCRAFHSFRKEKSSDEAPSVGDVKLSAAQAVELAAVASSTTEGGGGGGGGGSKGEDKGQSNWKARRCCRRNCTGGFFMLFNNLVVHMLLHLNKLEN